MRRKMMFLLLCVLGFAPNAWAQSEAALPFLLIQPSARANGMGQASLVSGERDPLAVAFNPAHPAMTDRRYFFVAEFYHDKTQWLPEIAPDLTYDAATFQFGVQLGRVVPIRLAAAYTRIDLNLGKQVITGPDSPEPIAEVEPKERVDVYSVAASAEYYVQLGIGMSFKSVYSRLAGLSTGKDIYAEVNSSAQDWGVSLALPIFKAIARGRGEAVEFLGGMQPFLSLGAAYSASNIGDEVAYIDARFADPLPRVARVAAQFNTGLQYRTERFVWQLFGFDWISEGEQTLVELAFEPERNVIYHSGLRDINFWSDVVSSKTNEKIIQKKGWEYNFLDVLAIQRGEYRDYEAEVYLTTKGTSVRLAGVLKALDIFLPDLRNGQAWRLLRDHLDVRYEGSTYVAAEGHPLDGITFKSISVWLH